MPDAVNDHRMTRRQALGLGAATMVMASVGVVGRAVADTVAPVPSYLRRAGWAEQGGTALDVPGSGSLTLREVRDVGSAKARALAGSDDAFVLSFDGASGLEQGTHAVRHAALGDFDLFLVPVGGRDGADQGYEAVIDRSIRRASAIAEAPKPGDPPDPGKVHVVQAAAAPAAEPAAAEAGTAHAPHRKVVKEKHAKRRRRRAPHKRSARHAGKRPRRSAKRKG